jgi:dihydrofolate synthase/folylpolyglutamate synthase
LQGACFPTVQEALEKAKQDASIDDLIFIGGSTFVVAEIS